MPIETIYYEQEPILNFEPTLIAGLENLPPLDSKKTLAISAIALSAVIAPASIAMAETASASVKPMAQVNELTPREQARCKAQEKIEPKAFTSCEYPQQYNSQVAKNPDWVEKQHLAEPGKEKLNDRMKLYFKTYPKEYKMYRLEIDAGKKYHSPNYKLWLSVNQNECSKTWNCNTGNGYYGGLQMDVSFERTYNWTAYKLWGNANKWPKNSQMLAADRAYNGYHGAGARGLTPWPSSRREFGSYPVPVRKKA